MAEAQGGIAQIEGKKFKYSFDLINPLGAGAFGEVFKGHVIEVRSTFVFI